MNDPMKITLGLLQMQYQSKVKYKKGIELVKGDDGNLVEREFTLPDYLPGNCADAKCGRAIRNEEKCFVDTWNNRTYCQQCGKCIRYERAMALRRGEDPRKVEVLGD